MKTSSILVALAFTSSLATAVHAADDTTSAAAKDPKASFYEHGRFGVIGALTEDMWKGGFVFEHQHFEAQVLGHVGLESPTQRDVHVIFKVGGRIPLGTLNYLAIGAEFGPHPGSLDRGQKIGSSFQTGPYVSLQRYFAATPVMLVLWVNPVQYDHTLTANDEGTGTVTNNAVRVFQSGGFGISYLF